MTSRSMRLSRMKNLLGVVGIFFQVFLFSVLMAAIIGAFMYFVGPT